MKGNQIGSAFQDSFESIKSYIDIQVKYNKLLLTQKLGDITSYFAMLFIITALAGGLLFFLSFAFVYWFAKTTDLDVYIGYLIVAGFYLVLIGLIINFKERLLFSPIRNLLGSILFENEMPGSAVNSFSNKESMTKMIKELDHQIHQHQEELTSKFHVLQESLTLANISQQLFQNVYSKVVTTSNVARIAFLLIKRLKQKSSKKKKST
ncbi:MAG: hypothetical protein A2W85_05965 [Bacteroidetes bacterium GWF2_41_31]|nr:MAG: hypothetical protein A2W85_05965 [Bacteroidetes bacterium GWF2_41_31]OFZ03199.1 MAG: hypothetical protein A2338_09615 [Bacteroidetes bacterium RIFOXYB12_FULL_41_6]